MGAKTGSPGGPRDRGRRDPGSRDGVPKDVLLTAAKNGPRVATANRAYGSAAGRTCRNGPASRPRRGPCRRHGRDLADVTGLVAAREARKPPGYRSTWPSKPARPVNSNGLSLLMKAAVLGDGSWGNAFAQVLCDRGHSRDAVGRTDGTSAAAIRKSTKTRGFLPGLTLPPTTNSDHRRRGGGSTARPSWCSRYTPSRSGRT